MHGRYTKRVLQISLVRDSKADEKKEVEHGPAIRNLAPHAVATKIGSDTNTVLVVRYVNHVSMRNGLASHWSIYPAYILVIHIELHRYRDNIVVSFRDFIFVIQFA